MTDLEAYEELAKALDHISIAYETVEADHPRREIRNLMDSCHDKIDGLLTNVAAHDCDVEGVDPARFR